MANELDQITGGLEENIALSNIRKQKAEEQANQHEQLRSEFDDYARGGTGEPLDMNRVEAYKNQVPSHMFQASLYKLQEETYPVGESFSTPILDQYVGDDPNAYKDYEAYDNRQASMNRAYRIKDYHYGMFTYDSRADYPNMNDEAYEIMSVGGYFSEMYNKPMDEVVKNMDTYVGMYGNQKNIKDPNIKSVFDQIKGEVFDMGESMKRDDQYWSEGLDMALRGDSIEKTVTGKLGTPEGDRQAQVYRMAADYIYGEYGNNIIKAKEYLTLLGEGDKRPETLDARKPSGAEVQGRLKMANQLMEESPEDRQEILSLIFKLAELEGEEVEGAVNRVAKSMQRAISGSIEDITSGSTKALLDPNVFIPKALEIKDDKIAEPLRQRTELMQDLRMARNIYKDIEAQGTGEMIAQTTAANIHYAGMFALGWAGFGAMALDMASKRDEQLRIEYPDMSPDTRWSISQADAVVDASLERFKYKMVFSGFPTLTKFVGGTGVRRAAGVFGVRVASAQATNYAEEVAQNMTNPIFHKMWVAAGADIPDVTQEDWDRNFWMMEDGDKVPFIDGELFVSLLGMSMLGAGGRGAYDKFGGANVKRILSDKDKLLLQGFPEAQADAIIEANKNGNTTKAFEMFQDGLEDMSQQERRANMNQAKADGADRRVLKAELDEYKQRVEEDGTEDDKVNLRVREAQFDFAMKYDAHLEEREDGRWDFVSPNTDVAPNQTFETKEQADEAMLQHYQKVDQMFLGAMAEQAQRIDAMPKNKEAMKLAVKELKEAQAKAGVEADIALDQDLTTLAEFGAQSKKNMEIALERVQHELLRKNILRPATVKDLEAWTINAQVTLAKNGRGYVQKVAKGGNIADVYEDASEGFLKTMIHKDVVSKDWVKEQLFKYQKDSGDSVKWGFKSVEDITDGRMVEAFSDLAKANLWNASKDNKMGKLSSLIRALKQFFKSILDAAESLLKLQAEGKIDTDFQTLLDQSVGLNMDEQIARQTEEVRQEILGDVEGTSLSVTPEMTAEEKQIGEGADTEAGTPAPDSPAETIKPDDSKPEIDWSDPSYSVSPKSLPEVFPLMTEELANQILSETDTTSAIHIDRMRVGEFEGVPLQGGMFYPSIVENLESRIAWAFNSIGVARTVVDRAAQHGGYVKLVLMTEGNVVGNKTFATIWLNRMDNILNTEEKKAEFMDEFHKVRKAAIKSIVNKKRNAEKKANEAAEKKGEKPAEPVDEMTLATYHRDGEKVTSYDQVREFMLDMGQSDRGSHYLTRGTQGKATKVRAKGETIYGKLLGAQLSAKRGYPDAKEIVEAIEEPAFKGMKKGDVVGLIKLDAIEKGSPIQTATEAGVTEHLSYNYVVKGEPVAKMKNIHNIEDMYPSIAGQMMSQQNKSYDAKEHITFSIAQDATYMGAVKSGDMDTAQEQEIRDNGAESIFSKLQDYRKDAESTDKRVSLIDEVTDVLSQMFNQYGYEVDNDYDNGASTYWQINLSFEADEYVAENNLTRPAEGTVRLSNHKGVRGGYIWSFGEGDSASAIKRGLDYIYDEMVDADLVKMRDEISFSIGYQGQHQPAMAEDGASGDNLTDIYPDDIYGSDAVSYYGDGSAFDQKSIEVIRRMRGKPNAQVAIYRSIPSEFADPHARAYELEQAKKQYQRRNNIPAKFDDGSKSGSEWYEWASEEIDRLRALPEKTAEINAGDWVSINRQYAKMHGEAHLNGDYEILTKRVKAKEIFTEGNSIHEWGYDPSGDTTMSIAPAEDAVMGRITALMRDPDAKLEVYKNMASRLNKVRERIYNKRIAYGKMTAESMSEADKEMDEREFIISSVAQIEAIARVLPPQVSRKLGTMKRASEYKTSKGFARYVSQRLDKVDLALEKYLRKELRADVNKLIKRSQPASKQRASDKGQSKIGDVGHKIAKVAQEAVKLTPEQAGRKAEDLRQTLFEMEDPSPAKIQEHEDLAYVYEMFADIANADSNRLSMMKNLMKTNWDEGRKQWLGVLEKRKDWKDSKAKAIASSLSKIGKSITEKNNAGGMQSVLANAAREQLSFYNITDLLKEDMKGAGSKVVAEMTNDFRRANNSFEWMQLQHKEEMKQVFSDIFGIKSKNRTARVQARLNSLAKQVDQGSKVTVVDRHNPSQRISVGNMSQLDLLKDWLAVQQLDLKDKYDSAGHDEKYRSQLDDALDDDVKELGLWMQNKLREMTPDTEKLHRSEYGLAMATVENYFPAVFEHKLTNQESRLQIDGIDVAGVSKRPSAHKMRVNHNSDPKRQNAVHTFNHHIMQDAFWKSHAEVLRKWAGVLRSQDVQLAIRASKGEGFLAHVNKRLDDIETQGSAVAQVQLESDRFFRTVGKGMSLGILGMKLSTIWKNFSALSNVALGVEAKDLISGLRPEAFKEAKELLKSETFQRRLKMGASVATRYALEGGKSGNLLFSTTTRMAEVGVQGINIADTGSNLTMAIAYVAKLKKLRAENVSEADAKEQALDYVDDLMARYAQPTDRLSKSMFENSRSPIVKFLVMFQSEPRKQMAINALAVRKLVMNKGAQSKSLAAQQLLVQVVGVNAFIHAVTALYGALFKGYGEGDDAEEKFINDISDGNKLLSMMIGESFSGIPIAGELISGQVKRAMGQDVFSSSSNPLTRTVGAGSTQMLSVISKWDQRSASENADAILRGIQMLGSVAPQTAVLSQASNITRDTLGFVNNTLATGLTKEDTYNLYEKRIKKVVTKVHESTADEMRSAKENKERRMIRSIETQRREEIIARSREILLEMDAESRRKFIEQQDQSDNGIEKYLIKEFKIDF